MYRALGLALALAACDVGVDTPSSSVDAGDMGSNNGGGGGTNSYYYRFAGGVPTTGVIPFGGSPYCDYSVELTQIVVDVVMRDSGHFVGGVLTDTMTEKALNGCPYGVAPPNPQVFEYVGSPVAGDNSFSTSLVAHPGNYPATNTSLTISAPTERVPTANVRWKRTDQPAPLDWEANVSAVELQPVPCESGSVVCLGKDQGAIYSCQDGLRMLESKRCAGGCADATSCR